MLFHPPQPKAHPLFSSRENRRARARDKLEFQQDNRVSTLFALSSCIFRLLPWRRGGSSVRGLKRAKQPAKPDDFIELNHGERAGQASMKRRAFIADNPVVAFHGLSCSSYFFPTRLSSSLVFIYKGETYVTHISRIYVFRVFTFHVYLNLGVDFVSIPPVLFIPLLKPSSSDATLFVLRSLVEQRHRHDSHPYATQFILKYIFFVLIELFYDLIRDIRYFYHYRD